VLALPAAAGADTTLGLTTQPAGSTAANCAGAPVLVGQATSDPSTPYAVPAGGGAITGWSINTSGDSTGTVTLRVLRPTAGDYQVVGPANALTGYPTLLTDTVANGGPMTGPTTLTDVVPAGLTIDSVIAGQGSCTTAGQTVTCSVTGLAAGASTPVEIIVTPSVARSCANAVTVTPPTGVTDPNQADSTATATSQARPQAQVDARAAA
jgi:hypothetical protein